MAHSAAYSNGWDGNTAIYHDAVSGGDLVVTATASGFSHSLVLSQPPPADFEVRVPIASHGDVVSTPESGGIEITSDDGDVVASAPQPLMWDSSTSEVTPAQVEEVDASTEGGSG